MIDFDMVDLEHALTVYYLPAVFVGAFLFGESVIITASFLAAQFGWPLLPLFGLSLTGTVLSDIGWFYGGKFLMRYAGRWERYRTKYQATLAYLEKLAGSRPFLVLLFIKFLYGTRIITIIYLSWRQITLKNLLVFDTIGSAIWLALIIGIGWLAGKGIANFIPVVDTAQKLLISLVLVVVISKLALWLTSFLGKR